MNCSISSKLLENYDNYYDAESEWRSLGAVDKAANIVEMCGSHPHSTVVEIGCGEGAILERLSRLKFGDSLFALEISRTGRSRMRRTQQRPRCSRVLRGPERRVQDHRARQTIRRRVLAKH